MMSIDVGAAAGEMTGMSFHVPTSYSLVGGDLTILARVTAAEQHTAFRVALDDMTISEQAACAARNWAHGVTEFRQSCHGFDRKVVFQCQDT